MKTLTMVVLFLSSACYSFTANDRKLAKEMCENHKGVKLIGLVDNGIEVVCNDGVILFAVGLN